MQHLEATASAITSDVYFKESRSCRPNVKRGIMPMCYYWFTDHDSQQVNVTCTKILVEHIYNNWLNPCHDKILGATAKLPRLNPKASTNPKPNHIPNPNRISNLNSNPDPKANLVHNPTSLFQTSWWRTFTITPKSYSMLVWWDIINTSITGKVAMRLTNYRVDHIDRVGLANCLI